MANTANIQILRSYANTAPTTLLDGQLAYSFVSNTLFIGSNTGVISIGDPSTALIARAAAANTVYTQGVDLTQNTKITNVTTLAQSAFNAANNVTSQIQPAFDQANTSVILANLAFNSANTAAANTVFLQSINDIQNTTSAAINTYAYSAYSQANTASLSTVYLQGALNAANANIAFLYGIETSQNSNTIFLQGALATANANTVYTQGVDATQNTWISSNSLYSQAAFAQANLTAGGLVTANANTIFLSGALATTNANTVFLAGALNTANANIAFLYGIETTQNNWINSNSLYSQAAYAQANLTSGGLNTANGNTIFLAGALATTNANTVFLTGVNNTQNANISVLFTNTSPNLYLTTVGSSVNSIALGGAPVQNAQVWGTYTIVQVLDTLLFPTTGPTYTIPTITLSANNSGTFEIGQPINQALTVTGTKNDAGVFTQLRINRNTINLTTNTSPTTTTTTNIASQFGFSDPNNQNYTYANTYVDANTIVSGATTWTGYGNYNAGLAKLNNKGVTDSNAFAVLTTTAPQAANATTFATASTTITGIYPYFWGVSSTQPTAASIATAIAAGTQNKVLAVGSGTLTITYNASSQYIWIAVQTGYAAKTTWYNTALNNGSIGAGQFILSPVSQAVTSPNAYWSAVNYNIYISGYATTTSGTIQFS
jgi:hypothetical protein